MGSMPRSIASCCMGRVIILVNRGGNAALNRTGEFDTKNEAEVVANDASPCHTGVYGEELAAATCSGCGSFIVF